jgi:uncharacterized protein YjiS (DUF1127 family)
MTIACEFCGRGAASAEEGAAGLLATLARAWAGARSRLRHRRDYARLLDLDDHLLADIGLTRDQAREALGPALPDRWTAATRLGPAAARSGSAV